MRFRFCFADEGFLPEPKTNIDDINRMLAAQALEEQNRAEALSAAQEQAQAQAQDVDMDVDMEEDTPTIEKTDKDEDEPVRARLLCLLALLNELLMPWFVGL